MQPFSIFYVIYIEVKQIKYKKMRTIYEAPIYKDRRVSNFIFKNAYEIARAFVANFKDVYNAVKIPNRENAVGVTINYSIIPYNDEFDKIIIRMGIFSDIVRDDSDNSVLLTAFADVNAIPKIGTLTDYFADLLEENANHIEENIVEEI